MPDQDPKPPVTPSVSAPGEPRAVAAAPMTAEGPEPDHGVGYIVSPFLGNFYLQARPTDPPFVKVGAVVRAGQTVCVIEAMKLFNEIQAELDCVIEEILVTNGQPVEFGTKLFRVRPL